jgi:hypothetical protein
VTQHPVDAVAGEAEAEVIGGDFGHGVGFVEHDEIVGEEYAFFGGAVCDCPAGGDEGEEEGVVHNHNVGGT